MTTTAPRWINLDELVPQDLRAEMAALTERVSTYGWTIDDELVAFSLDQRWHAEVHDNKGVTDEAFNLVMDWTGYSAFYDARLAAGVDPESVAIDPPID